MQIIIFVYNLLTSNLRVFIKKRFIMKYAIKKQSRKKVSPLVLRAIARINDYENRRANYSNVWNQKSTNYSSLTS